MAKAPLKVDPTSLVVVLDAMGVIYEAGDDVEELLIPFVRRKECQTPDEEIRRSYIECSLGRCSSAAFWESLEVTGDPRELDAEYLAGHRLSLGLLGFLDTLKGSGIPVACLSNDVSEWSLRLRQTHGLEEYIGHWTISGEVGARKPARAIYERLLEGLGCDPRHCLFVDDRPANLDTALTLRFRTALFAPGGSPRDPAGHPNFADFEELEDWILRLNT